MKTTHFKRKKKLALNKETIAHLAVREMRHVHGGGDQLENQRESGDELCCTRPGRTQNSDVKCKNNQGYTHP